MESLANLVKTFVPGSLPFLLLAVTAGVALLYPARTALWARRWLTFIVLLYLVLSTPAVAIWLEKGIHPDFPRIERPDDARGATTIVVLGNGIVTYAHEGRELYGMTRRTSMNVLEGARLHRLLGRARVIVSGGVPHDVPYRKSEAELMAEAMAGLGVPRDRTVVESHSRNTFEQSQRVAALLDGDAPVVLVTTPIHMSRALAYFRARGVDVIPSAAHIEYTTHPLTWRLLLVPSVGALRMSELTIYERLAAVLGWARGWARGS